MSENELNQRLKAIIDSAPKMENKKIFEKIETLVKISGLNIENLSTYFSNKKLEISYYINNRCVRLS